MRCQAVRTWRLTRQTDALGSVSYCYDARGNLLEKIRSSQPEPTVSLAPNELRYRVAYRYTLANQLAAVIYPDGDELRYTRNSAGQITQVVYASKQSNGSFLTETVVQSAQYAPFGALTQLSFGNGSQWTRTLDQNYAIDAISSAALNLDATLDDVGNFTGLISSGQSYQFGYDPLYRLSELRQGSSVLEHFDYDATGNRTAANLGGAAQSYAYPTNSHRLQSINGISRDYDNAGNTTWSGGLNYRYNGRNRLSQVSMGRTTYYSNTYNARGEREEKSLTNGMTVQRFIYDEAGRLIQTGNVPPIGLTRTLKPEQRLLWLDDQLVGVKMMKVESNAYAGELLYAHTDHLGTPRALSRPSANNSIVWRWPLETSAFGQHPAQSDPDGDGQVLTFNLRYPGQYFDTESGLHYNYFRDYEAGTGRYIESDPIGLDGGISTYGYVANQPLSLTDPQGLDYWVEDADPSESGLGFHQSVCVGKLGTPNRYCISFGRKPGQADCWFECKGHVYRDRSPPGDVVRPFHRMTSPETDRQIRTYLESRLGDADRPWDALGGENCRAFSQNVFGYLLRTYDGLPSPYSGK